MCVCVCVWGGEKEGTHHTDGAKGTRVRMEREREKGTRERTGTRRKREWAAINNYTLLYVRSAIDFARS